jgi:hypothetical protein
MTRAERYADRKARKVCVDCGLEPAKRRRVRCVGCAAKASEATMAWEARNRVTAQENRNHRQESLYWSNPEAVRAELKERRLYKMANGICVDCPEPSVEGRSRCKRCLKSNVIYAQRTAARKRRREERAIKAYAPLDEIVDLNRVHVLRAARRLDWFDFADLREAAGCADGESVEANTLVVALTRMTRAGMFERRPTQVLRSSGSRYDYRITAVGCEYLDAVLGGRVIPRRQRRKAA